MVARLYAYRRTVPLLTAEKDESSTIKNLNPPSIYTVLAIGFALLLFLIGLIGVVEFLRSSTRSA